MVHASRLFFSALAIFAATLSSAEIIPADRRVDWTPGVTVGVPGGIPENRTRLVDVTLPPYRADKTGATDASGAIQSAINAATAGDVVFLPAGTYLCARPISTGYKSGITLRGAGANTVLNSTVRSGTFLQVGGGSDYNWAWPASGNTVTAGLTKGSTQLSIADTSAFSPGQLIKVVTDNDPTLPVVSVYGYQGLRCQMTRVTAKTATTLTIFPALYGDYSSTRTVVRAARSQANSVGIESMVIDMSRSSATFSVWLQQAYGCWVKDVHVRYSANYHLFLNDSLNCEVRRSNLQELNHSGSNGAGLLCNTISGCLIEDNIITKAFPLIEVNHGSSGNVFAYNFGEDSGPGVAIDSNHGPHNNYNLYEGNIAPNLQSDGYYGSASHDTVFRNWFHGTLDNRMAWAVSLNRFTRNYTLVGNILLKEGLPWAGDGVSLGNPNMGNGDSRGSAPPWTDGLVQGAGLLSQSGQAVTTTVGMFNRNHVGSFIYFPSVNALASITAYQDSQHVTLNTSQSLTNVPYIVSPGPAGYQGLDSGVAATLIRRGNFYYYRAGIPAAEALGNETLPNSLFRTEKPAWFGNLAWPPFDPTRPAPTALSIPAGFRAAKGMDPSGSDSVAESTPLQKPMNVKISR